MHKSLIGMIVTAISGYSLESDTHDTVTGTVVGVDAYSITVMDETGHIHVCQTADAIVHNPKEYILRINNDIEKDVDNE